MKKEKILNYFFIVLGNFSLALGVSLFVLPKNIINGGTSGVGILLRGLFEFEPTLIIFILTWFLFFVGWAVLGRKFAMKTLVATIVYPLFVALLSQSTFFENLAKQVTTPLLAAIAGGVLSGVGLGIVFKNGGSTGGFDVLSLIMNKYLRIKLSLANLILDSVIILGGLLILPLENILLGIIYVTITSYTIEKILVGQTDRYFAHIISEKVDLINDYINHELSRGTTILLVEGGFTKESKKMIEVAFGRQEYAFLKQGIKEIDPNAFIGVLKAVDVYGEGFLEIR